MNDKDFLELAVKKAKESVEKGGFPAGAVLVKDGAIISDGVSLGFLFHDPTSHAETSTIRQACKKLKTTDLSGAVLYASLQPCIMCYCSANWARVSRIVFGCKKTTEMVKKEYYEGAHDLEELNRQSNHRIELEYISDYEDQVLDLICKWEKSL
ncbi:MAG: nucleoside deaminase [Patescibacteria group bacterium]|nr:nucleoside deaminase [Patescibacteria group bacterium]